MGNNKGPWDFKPPDPWGMLRQIFARIRKRVWGPLGPGHGMRAAWTGVGAMAALWVGSGFYKTELNEQAIVLRFGRIHRLEDSGLHYHLPYPIEKVIVQDVTAVNQVDGGAQQEGDKTKGLALTGDENIAEINFTVLWSIKDVIDFTFTARNPRETINAAAESVIREMIAQTPMVSLLTEGRTAFNQKAQTMLQQLVDEYHLGIHIQELQMGKIDPPATVIDAYRDVQRAKADRERKRNEAEAYRDSALPSARAQAASLLQTAHSYHAKTTNHAQGESERMRQWAVQYMESPQLTQLRLYLQAMNQVLTDNPKFISDGAWQKILPHFALPAPDLKNKEGEGEP